MIHHTAFSRDALFPRIVVLFMTSSTDLDRSLSTNTLNAHAFIIHKCSENEILEFYLFYKMVFSVDFVLDVVVAFITFQ